MPETLIPASSRWRFQTAMILAVAADALQMFVLPLFAEGALSPADDLLDLGVAAVLVRLLSAVNTREPETGAKISKCSGHFVQPTKKPTKLLTWGDFQ
jgi:formate hydrogenlyase subunit 4